MSIFWLQQTMADVPTGDNWLCAHEVLRLGSMRFAKRRADWRLGRWTAKCAIAAYLDCPVKSSVLDDIEIRPAASGAPEAFLAEQRAALEVSLSHCAGRAMAAIVPLKVPMGCDLETIEPRIDAFMTDYFNLEEQLLVQKAPASDRAALVTLLWSAKESALKALGQGLRLDTRSISVNVDDRQGRLAAGFQMASRERIVQPSCEPGPAGWGALQVVCRNGGRTFYGWWQAASDLVRTIVADASLPPPILLNPRLEGGE